MKTLKVDKACLLACGLFLIACGSNEDRLKDRAAIEAGENARQQVDAQNEYQKERATEMELDLARRQRYFDALSGTYEGTYEGPYGRPFQMKLILTSSLPAYVPPRRVRTLDEIENDLTNLSLNVQEIVWDEKVPMTAGCVYEKIKPDIRTGKIYLVSDQCNVSFNLTIGDTNKDEGDSSTLASKAMEGIVNSIQSLSGTGQSIYVSGQFRVYVNRVHDDETLD